MIGQHLGQSGIFQIHRRVNTVLRSVPEDRVYHAMREAGYRFTPYEGPEWCPAEVDWTPTSVLYREYLRWHGENAPMSATPLNCVQFGVAVNRLWGVASEPGRMKPWQQAKRSYEGGPQQRGIIGVAGPGSIKVRMGKGPRKRKVNEDSPTNEAAAPTPEVPGRDEAAPEQGD